MKEEFSQRKKEADPRSEDYVPFTSSKDAYKDLSARPKVSKSFNHKSRAERAAARHQNSKPRETVVAPADSEVVPISDCNQDDNSLLGSEEDFLPEESMVFASNFLNELKFREVRGLNSSREERSSVNDDIEPSDEESLSENLVEGYPLCSCKQEEVCFGCAKFPSPRSVLLKRKEEETLVLSQEALSQEDPDGEDPLLDNLVVMLKDQEARESDSFYTKGRNSLATQDIIIGDAWA